MIWYTGEAFGFFRRPFAISVILHIRSFANHPYTRHIMNVGIDVMNGRLVDAAAQFFSDVLWGLDMMLNVMEKQFENLLPFCSEKLLLF